MRQNHPRLLFLVKFFGIYMCHLVVFFAVFTYVLE
jgi:hypothetical protein